MPNPSSHSALPYLGERSSADFLVALRRSWRRKAGWALITRLRVMLAHGAADAAYLSIEGTERVITMLDDKLDEHGEPERAFAIEWLDDHQRFLSDSINIPYFANRAKGGLLGIEATRRRYYSGAASS